jgi:hypothetical protein
MEWDFNKNKKKILSTSLLQFPVVACFQRPKTYSSAYVGLCASWHMAVSDQFTLGSREIAPGDRVGPRTGLDMVVRNKSGTCYELNTGLTARIQLL